MSRVILASGSFLKNFIMEKSKIPYEVVEADIDESIYDERPVGERVRMLAQAKCQKIALQHADATVIAADTLTCDMQGHVFSKPDPESDPFQAALALSGRTIGVYTGCCVIKPGGEAVSTTAYAEISYQSFTERRLRVLAEGDNPNIRSGALGVFFDAPGFTLIKSINGSYSGAFGLPMEFVYAQLEG